MPEHDPVATLGEIDPKRVTKEEFAELLESASAAAAGDGVDLSSLGAEDFSRLISRASADQIEGVMSRPELRERVLDEVFRRMSEHYKSDKARGTEAVVRWRIGPIKDGDEANTLRYECVLSAGTCEVSKELRYEPRVTIMIPAVEFLKLATGTSSAPTMFMTGKLKVAGDVGFAAGLSKLFQIPKT